MPGQAIVTIKDRYWVVDVADTSLELAQGLGGLPELPQMTGILFDLGYEQTIEVTTMPMLFSLDIAFLADDLTITEVYRNIGPGYIITSQVLARYFLEVNAGELEGVEPRDSAFVEWPILEQAPVISDWAHVLFFLAGLLAIGVMVIGEMGMIDGY